MTEQHHIDPIFDQNSRILILGSFPSVKSREIGFYYGHPQNRFWKMLSCVTQSPLPTSTDEKITLLLSNRIALWDVIASCEITGSSDSSIRNAVPNEVERILQAAPIEAIYTNGQTAHRLYQRYLQPRTQIEATCLPSTSPANAAWSLDRLAETWRIILP